MGTSTDGITFYGYCWDEEEVELPESATELFGRNHPVLVGDHCSSDYPMPYVYIQSSEKTAYRGRPVKLLYTDLVKQYEWDGQLEEFCATHSITPPEGDNQPGWWLVSYWG